MFTETVLRRFCAAVGIQFEAEMLTWPPIPADQRTQFLGPADIEAFGRAFEEARESSGFRPHPASSAPPELKDPEVGGVVRATVERARPVYLKLKALC